MKRFFTAFIFLMTTLAWAQPQAVTWSTSYENTDEHTVITVHAEIEKVGTYTANLTKVDLFLPPLYSKMILLTIVGGWTEESLMGFDPNFDMDLAYFSDAGISPSSY